MQTASRLREYTRRAERRVDNAKRQGKLRGGGGAGGAVGEEKGEGCKEEEEEEQEEEEEEEEEEEAEAEAEEEAEESAPEPVSAEDVAALRITHFVRGVAARKKGLEYSRSFGDGPLGMMVDNLMVSFVADEGQAAALKVAVGSRLLSINGRRMDNDMDMVSAVQTMARPLEMWFTLVKKPDATNRYGMAWQLDGGFEKAGKKWKAKFLELADDGTLSTRLKAKSKAREALQLAECCVEELKAEGEHESFVAQHTVGQFGKSSGPLFFFRVYDAAKEVAKAAAAEEEAREAREAAEAGVKTKKPKKKKKKPAKGAPPEELVLCLDDENEYKGWMAVLRRRALKESALPVVDVRARATSVNPMLAGKGGEG
jgi:pyruvate/2-oxoglutarate dehydrogenase complex dihydrolipoamide acyltransferase (E2) component